MVPSTTPSAETAPQERPEGRTRLARVVAGQIQNDILSSGWRVGEVLGSETALLERYGVSRAVFREAVRLVEHKQIARMRRGPGGGLVVTVPEATAVVDAVTVYLQYEQIALDELFEARMVIEDTATDLAAQAMGEAEIVRLRERIAEEAADPRQLNSTEHQRLHSLIASLTGNPAIELFVEILASLTPLYTRAPSRRMNEADRRRAADQSAEAHRAIVDALVAGDAGLARHRMKRHLEATAEWLRRRRRGQTLAVDDLAANGTQNGKLAEVVARRIFWNVVERGWPVGEVLGSEADMLAEHGVSRAAFREAVRLLEHHNVAAMRRGPGGGLVVTAPDASAITDAMFLYLESRGITPQQLYDIRRGLELASVRMAAERSNEEALGRLHQVLEQELASPTELMAQRSHDLHIAIADLAGNRAIWLFIMVLTRLTAQHSGSAAAERERALDKMAHDVHRAHRGIVAALDKGDASLATHRMQRHLQAVTPWLR